MREGEDPRCHFIDRCWRCGERSRGQTKPCDQLAQLRIAPGGEFERAAILEQRREVVAGLGENEQVRMLGKLQRSESLDQIDVCVA